MQMTWGEVMGLVMGLYGSEMKVAGSLAGLLRGRWSCVSLVSRRCSHDLSNSDSGTETPKSKLTIFHLPWQESQTVRAGSRTPGEGWG